MTILTGSASVSPSAFWYLTRGSGVVTLVLLTATVSLGVLTSVRWRSKSMPRFVVAGLHRNLALLSVAFLAIHVGTTVADGYTPIGLKDAFVPFLSPYRPIWLGLGALSSDLLAAVVLTSLLRGRFGFRMWRAVHWLAYASWPLAVVHSVGTGSDARFGWMAAVALVCTGAVAVSVLARVVHGDADFASEVTDAVANAACALAWRPELADEIVAMRERMEAGRGARDLKRGAGGVVDVEFLVQMFQLKYGRERPALRMPNTWEALDALLAAGLLSAEEHAALQTGYDFLRRVQGRLRIVHNRTLDELPEAMEEVNKLARRLGYEAGGAFLAELDKNTKQIRNLFIEVVARERGAS